LTPFLYNKITLNAYGGAWGICGNKIGLYARIFVFLSYYHSAIYSYVHIHPFTTDDM